ncbi:MAG: hypothetical protein J6R94_00445 [Agathobacter sp.]|nr:hypothetical protein [Agathobacter sp.]
MRRENYYSVTKIDDYVYRLNSQENVAIDVFVGTQNVLVFDTGNGFGDLRGTIATISNLPPIVVNSHGHFDHANGNYQFSDCPIYMNERDWWIHELFCTAKERATLVEESKRAMVAWDQEEPCNILPEDFDEEAYINCPASQLQNIQDGMVFALGNGITLRVIETPGHTAGSICLLREETGELYVGDSINRNLLLAFFNAPLEDYLASLGKLQQLPYKRLLPAHTNDWIEREEVDLLVDAILHPDRENCKKVSPPNNPEVESYLYVRKGYTMADSNQWGYFSFIVDHML